MDDPFKYFRVEARELAGELMSGMLALERGSPTAPAVAGMLRGAHTLKGAARVVKQIDIADQAHALEDVLVPFRETHEALPSDALSAALGCLERISDLVAAIDGPPGSSPAPTPSAGGDAGVRTVRADLVEMDALVDGLREAHTQLARLQECTSAMERARSLTDLISQQLLPRTRERGTGLSDAAMATGRSVANELREVLTELERRFADATTQVDRELRLVRDSAEGLRLVPAGVLFTDLERAARDVAHEQGKRIRFAAAGGDIRLDAHVVAATQGALQQIVRNAVAHGIETEGARRLVGKPAEGSIVLSVERRGRRVVFSCRDDGRGVDLEAVRSAAQRRGLLRDGAAGDDPETLMNMLLAGGISTYGQVTEVAGRGIGLDVVRESAVRLGAQVRVSTQLGLGTTVEFDAPLSLVAFDALIVESGRSIVAIPVDSVRRAVRVSVDDIATTSRGDVLVHDGVPVPLVSLSSVLDRVGAAHGDVDASRSAVVVRGRSGLAALAVDRLLGTGNVVIRPLPDGLVADETVAGAWLDADGNPQLVLDPDGLVSAAQRGTQRTERRARPAPILVIDDSLTTRMLEQSILEAAGYDVEVAASAEEGMDKAHQSTYSLFLVDIEMPGMDGFTFVERTRADADLQQVPCILVSSRASADDRQRGLRAGARAHIAKGEFDQGTLLGTIRTLVGA